LCVASVACIAVFGVHVDTGRQNLVSEENVDAKRFRRFADLFGATLNAVVVIDGPSATQNRAYADELAKALQARPDQIGGVFYRILAEDFRKYALLYATQAQLERLAEVLEKARELGGQAGAPFALQGIAGVVAKLNGFFARLEEGDTEGLGPLDNLRVDTAEATPIVADAFRVLRQVLTGPPTSALEVVAEAGVTEIQAAGLDANGYLTANEGKLVFLFVQPASADEQMPTLTAFVDTIEEEAHRLLPSGVEVGVTGYPAHIATEGRLVVRDVWMTSLASFVGVLVLFLAAYRSLRQTVFMLVPLVAGTLLTVGAIAITVGRINLLSSSFLAFLIGLGVDFSIHVITRFSEAMAAGRTIDEAMSETVLLTGRGIVTGALTTIAAFAALLASDFTGQAELGVLAAAGLCFVLAASLTLTPALLADYYERKRSRTNRQPATESHTVALGLGRWIHRPGWVLGAALALTAALAPAIRPLVFDFDVSNLLPADAPAVTAYEKLRKNNVFSPDFAVILAKGEAHAREITRTLQQRPDLVARVESAATYLPPDQPAKAPALARVQAAKKALPSLQWTPPPASSAADLLRELERFASYLEVDLPLTLKMNNRPTLLPVAEVAAKEARITIAALEQVPRAQLDARLTEVDTMIGGVIGDTLALLDRESPTMTPAELPAAIGNAYVRQSGPDEIYAVRIFPKGSISDPIFMSEFRTLLTALDPEVTGLPMTFLAWGELFRQGLEQSAFVALFLIVFLVWLDFRNVRYTALAFLPLVLGTVWMVGAMNWLSIDYNFANVIALPLILGIGIDSGVHVLHRYREGTTPDRLPLTTGKAVLMSSLTTVLAFGTLAAASHRGLQTLGITLVIGVVGCLLSSSLVLPALLQWLKIINPAKKSP
jgi:hypothetical protein